MTFADNNGLNVVYLIKIIGNQNILKAVIVLYFWDKARRVIKLKKT